MMKLPMATKKKDVPAEAEKPVEAKPAETKPADTPAEPPKAEEVKVEEAPPKPEEPPKEETAPEPASPEPVEEKPKKSMFPFLGKGKKDPKGDVSAEASAKGEPKIVKKEPQATETPVYSNPAEIAKALDEQILQVKKGDYWVIRIKKQTLLVFMGVLLLTMWLFPLLQKITISKITLPAIHLSLPFLKKTDTITSAAMQDGATPTPSPQAAGPRIRIRYISGREDAANQVAEALKQAGYTAVDLAEDQQLSDTENSIVVKEGSGDIRTQLQTLFTDTYHLATGSAELAADSDFDALILLGKTK